MPEVLRKQGALTLAHGGGLAGFRVVVAEHVQDAVHDEQRQLVIDAAAVRRAPRPRRPPGTRRRRRGAPGRRRRARRRSWSTASSGNDSTSVGPVAAHVFGVQAGDLVRIDECQCQLAAHSFGPEHGFRQRGPTGGVDVDVVLLVAQTTISGPTPVGLGGSCHAWRDLPLDLCVRTRQRCRPRSGGARRRLRRDGRTPGCRCR